MLSNRYCVSCSISFHLDWSKLLINPILHVAHMSQVTLSINNSLLCVFTVVINIFHLPSQLFDKLNCFWRQLSFLLLSFYQLNNFSNLDSKIASRKIWNTVKSNVNIRKIFRTWKIRLSWCFRVLLEGGGVVVSRERIDWFVLVIMLFSLINALVIIKHWLKHCYSGEPCDIWVFSLCLYSEWVW